MLLNCALFLFVLMPWKLDLRSRIYNASMIKKKFCGLFKRYPITVHSQSVWHD